MAEIDLSQYAVGGAAARADSFTGMNPALVSRLQQLYAAAPASVKADLRVMSGYRSPQTQKPLWDAAVKKYGSAAAARRWVAPPGKSQHGKGFAADFDHFNWSPATRKWVHEHAKDFGLHFPLKNEDWHIEVIGARTGKLTPILPQSAPIPAARPTSNIIPPALLSTPAYRELAQGLLNAGVLNIGGKTVPYVPPALTPAPVGRVTSGGPLKPATAAPPRPVPSALNPAPVGRVESGGALRPASLPPDRPMPSGPIPNAPQPDRIRPMPTAVTLPPDRPMPTKTTLPPDRPMPTGPVKTSPAYGGPDVRPMPSGALPTTLAPDRPMPMGALSQANLAPPVEPVPVVKPLPPPLPVLAPKLPAPRVIRDFPVAAPQDVFPAAPPPPPAYTPMDVYAGLAPQAMSASGNMVSRDAYGRTQVTNGFGASTIMTPQGNQSAGSINPSMGGISGPLGSGPGIKPQTAVKMKTMAGGALGGLVAGPVGAIVGGLLARDLATGQPLGSTVRGLLGGNNSFQVRSSPGGPVQTQQFAAPNPYRNQFPVAPAAPAGGVTTPSGSNLSYSQMSSISPAAASAISRGQGGLY